jgi:hypothetical protein
MKQRNRTRRILAVARDGAADIMSVRTDLASAGKVLQRLKSMEGVDLRPDVASGTTAVFCAGRQKASLLVEHAPLHLESLRT